MAFELFQDVILTTDVPQHGLCAGDVGTIVERHAVEGKEDGFSIEFFDMTGRTVAVITLTASHLRQPTAADRPSVRAYLTRTSRIKPHRHVHEISVSGVFIDQAVSVIHHH